MSKLLDVVVAVAFAGLMFPGMGWAADSCPPELAEAKAALKSTQAGSSKGTATAKGQDVQAPRTMAGAKAQDVQAPRGQDVQSPRGQDVQSPRGQNVQAPRGQDVQSPRGQDVQAPRGQDVQAPRGQDVQSPRGQDVQSPRGQDVQSPRGQDVQAPRHHGRCQDAGRRPAASQEGQCVDPRGRRGVQEGRHGAVHSEVQGSSRADQVDRRRRGQRRISPRPRSTASASRTWAQGSRLRAPLQRSASSARKRRRRASC